MAGLQSQTTVVPTDFSEQSEQAIGKAAEITGTGTLHVVHVLAPLSTMEPGNLYGGVTDESRVESATKYLESSLAKKNVVGAVPHIAIGDPGREITELAEQVDADLIVMPSHGRGLIKRMLLGAVAERVVRLAHCPVLVLRS